MAFLVAEGLLLQGFETKLKKENLLFLGHEIDSEQRTLFAKVLNKDPIKDVSLNLALNHI